MLIKKFQNIFLEIKTSILFSSILNGLIIFILLLATLLNDGPVVPFVYNNF